MKTQSTGLMRLSGTGHDRPWGVMETDGPYAGKRIGEVWYDAGPLLIKFLTTANRLSVQVHPDDDYASKQEAHRGGRGKTEAWHIMSAKPGATIALGFSQPMTRDEIRQAAMDGSIEQKLQQVPVTAGQTVYIPAGTIHAIGAGIEICEIQQHCDITYRLFDYGSGRELHVDRSLDVTAGERGMAPGAGLVELPFTGPYFKIEHATPKVIGPGDWIVLEGEGEIDGLPYGPREVWNVSEPVEFQPRKPTKSLLVNSNW